MGPRAYIHPRHRQQLGHSLQKTGQAGRGGRDLVAKSASNEEELKNNNHEYLFKWRILEDNVILAVTLGLIHRRGFYLKPCSLAESSFPNLSDLHKQIAERTAALAPLDRGYQCGLAACDFRIRAPIKELAKQMSRWAGKERYSVD